MSVEFYEKNADRFIAQTAHVDMAALHLRFCKHLPPGASILDAGCGSGRDALAFSKLGFEVVAFDASPKMVAAARKRAGVPVYQMAFENMQFDQAFDGIWACASLLHVPRTQLSTIFERMNSLVKPAGVLYVSFKYGNKERVKDGRYFNDLDESLLAEHLNAVPNLTMAEIWTTTDVRPARSDERWLNCLLLKN